MVQNFSYLLPTCEDVTNSIAVEICMIFVQGCVTLSINMARRMDEGRNSMALVALVKATTSRLAREGTQLCREVMGGNGILLENGAAKALADIEVCEW